MIKRFLDIIFSFLGLIILFPFFLIIAFLIKITSKGSVFFKHERAGKDGKSFYPFKFRTMKQGSIKEGLGYDIAKNDKRITKIGNFLRRWSIDETPQLINVLKGEMSLVGPRPAFSYQVKEYTEFQRKRLLVKPGITGWAQVNGRNLLSWEQRIKYDVWYIENYSSRLDFKILFKTIIVVLLRKGIHEKEKSNDDFFI